MKNKQQKKSKSFILNILIIILFLLFVVTLIGLIYGIKTFWVGYHSIDLGQNLRYINAEIKQYNISFKEFTRNGFQLSGEQVFKLGVLQLEYSFWLIIISAFSLGVVTGWFILFSFLKNKKNKNG